MIQTKAVKSTALTTLRPKWLWAIAVSFLPVAAALVGYLIVAVLYVALGAAAYVCGALIALFAVIPLWLGTIRAFWRIANECDDPFTEAFCYFDSFAVYKRTISFCLVYAFRLFRKAVLFFIVPVLFSGFSDGWLFELLGLPVPLFAGHFSIVTHLLYVAASVLLLVQCIGMYLAPFLYVSDESLTPAQCVSRGLEIAVYTKGMFVSFLFGFLGWILLSLFLIPLLLTAPYLSMSYVVACRYSIACYNRLGSETVRPIYRV